MYPIAKWLYDTGGLLMKDDAGDLGYFTYRYRPRHYYHGKHSPRHESPFHHWQAGVAMMLAGQILGIVSVAQEAAEAKAEAEALFGTSPSEFV